MNAKEAIEFLEGEIYEWGKTINPVSGYVLDEGNPLAVKIYKKIISLLQQGERDRLFKQRLKSKAKSDNNDSAITTKVKRLIRKMIYQTEDYYKKYFSKEVKNDGY